MQPSFGQSGFYQNLSLGSGGVDNVFSVDPEELAKNRKELAQAQKRDEQQLNPWDLATLRSLFEAPVDTPAPWGGNETSFGLNISG